MKINKNHLSKELILDTTLRLIGENNGIRNVTLREIAKELGCTHTNLYNYFDSLDELFWEALAGALLKMVDYSRIDLTNETDLEENIYLIFSRIIDFSMDHPSWYRLIWIEAMNGKPSAEVAEVLTLPTKEFNEVIMKINRNKLSQEKVNLIGDILHSYLRGELVKWVNGRSFISSRVETKVMIMSNLKRLYEFLIQ